MGPSEKRKVKVNLYDPHKEPNSEIHPGPGDYFCENANKRYPSKKNQLRGSKNSTFIQNPERAKSFGGNGIRKKLLKNQPLS